MFCLTLNLILCFAMYLYIAMHVVVFISHKMKKKFLKALHISQP